MRKILKDGTMIVGEDKIFEFCEAKPTAKAVEKREPTKDIPATKKMNLRKK